MPIHNLHDKTKNVQHLLLLFLNHFIQSSGTAYALKPGMKQGDVSRIGKIHLINIILSGFLITLSLPVIATPQNIAIAWNPSVSPNIAGYDVYYGGLNGIYTNEIFAGNVTNITVPGLAGGTTYYFVATAVSSAGIQSSFSSQLSYTISSVPVLGLPVFSSSGFSFPVTGMTGSNCVIQVSTNLIQWIPLETNTVPFQFTDINANKYSERFYRAVYP